MVQQGESMTTVLKGSDFAKINTEALDAMRQYWGRQRDYILDEAKAKIRDEIRGEFCKAFGVKREEESDGEGGGSVQLHFPVDWTEDDAVRFAEDCLALDLSNRDGGPGRYFQQVDIAEYVDDDHIGIYIRWGLDI
jgi:hypothetical protein